MGTTLVKNQVCSIHFLNFSKANVTSSPRVTCLVTYLFAYPIPTIETHYTLKHTEVVTLIDFEKNPGIMLILRIPERELSYSDHPSAEGCSTGPGEIGEESEESGEPDS